MTASSNDLLESYLPVYDTVPEEWESARQFLVENMKRISNIVNAREIGFYLEDELLSGKQFFPTKDGGATAEQKQQNRDIFRKVIDMGAIVVGANSVAHGITFDDKFSLIQNYVSCTNSVTFNAATYVAPEVNIDVTNVTFTSPQAYDRAYCIIEYLLEK